MSKESFEKPQVKIGRVGSNDLVLDDKSISRVHACILKKGNRFFISDQRSSNGIFVNGQKLPPLADIPFPPGRKAVLGNFTVCLETAVATKQEVPKAKKVKIKRKDPAVSPAAAKTNTNLIARSDLIKIKQSIHTKLLDEIDLRRLNINEIGEGQFRDNCHKIVQRILAQTSAKIPENLDTEELIKDILDEALGLGPLEDFLSDPNVSEIMVNSKDKIYIERKGVIELSPKVFSSDSSVAGIIQRIVGPIGRRIDESSPLVDARLEDGSRVNAVIPPLALNGPCLTIRKFATTPLTVDNLVDWGALSKGMVSFIVTAVQQKQNVVISGGTGSGKTTLLNIFSSFIPQSERVVTIEDAAELQLEQEHIVRLESRPPNIEGKGAITIQDLVKNALRMRPDRIVVGECRSGETLDMLQAMNTGHDGSMTTGHANTPLDMLTRLETMVMMAGKDIPSQAIREQIASAVNIIVQQTRFSCGTRKVTQISEISEIIDGRIILQDIFYFQQDGTDAKGKVKGRFIATGWIPDFYIELEKSGIDVDMDIFQN